jgi:hypothetical protein
MSLITQDILALRGFTDVPIAIAVKQAHRAFGVLCQEADIWQHTFVEDLQQNVREYYLSDSPNSRVKRIHDVWLDGDRQYASAYEFDEKNQEISIRCTPVCDMPQAMKVTVSLYPFNEACEIPEEIASEWREAIADMTAYYLAMMAGQTWANLNLAREYGRKKADHIRSIKATNAFAGTAKNQRIVPPRF